MGLTQLVELNLECQCQSSLHHVLNTYGDFSRREHARVDEYYGHALNCPKLPVMLKAIEPQRFERNLNSFMFLPRDLALLPGNRITDDGLGGIMDALASTQIERLDLACRDSGL